MKEKVLLTAQNHLIQYAEIGSCPHAFQSPQGFRLGDLCHQGKQLLQLLADAGKGFLIHTHSVIPESPFHAPAGIVKFPENHVPGNPAASLRVVSHPVLFPPQQHIACVFSAYPGQKPSSGCAEGKTDPPVSAGPHQRRGSAGVGEGNDGLQGMQRIPCQDLLIPVGQHVFPLQGQINVLRCDE